MRAINARQDVRRYAAEQKIGIFMSLEPAVAALLGVVVLHELLSFRQWLAVALIIAASTGSTLTSRRPSPVVAGKSGEGWQGG